MRPDEIDLKRAMPHGRMAIAVAKRCYDKWARRARKSGREPVRFEDDLLHYLEHGFVVSYPTCFAMFKLLNLAGPGEDALPVWFVRMAVGDLTELLWYAPGRAVQGICYCRRNDGTPRIYRLDRFIAKAESYQRRKDRKILTWAAAA